MRQPKQLGKIGKLALKYQNLTNNRPLLETSTRAAICGFAGDIAAQLAIERRPLNSIDWKRTLRLTGIGLLVMGPMFAGGRTLLSRIGNFNEASRLNAIKESVVASLTMVPPIFATVIGTIGAMQNLKWDQIKSKIKDEIRYVVPVSWLVQGVLLIIIFAFPIKLHTYYATFLASEVLFATFLSNISNKDCQIETS